MFLRQVSAGFGRCAVILAILMLFGCGGGGGASSPIVPPPDSEGPIIPDPDPDPDPTVNHTVTSVVTAGGSISPATLVVEHGDEASFAVAVLPNYAIVNVSGCGGSLSGSVFTTASITADCVITASFTRIANAAPVIASDLYLVAGDEGKLFVSANGTVWESRDSGVQIRLNDIMRGKDLFVAVGDDGIILTSRDGSSWQAQSSGANEALNSVAWGNDRFVVVGNGGTVLGSEDGVTWSQVAAGFPGDLFKVVWAAENFVAVGQGDANGSILSSADGEFWNVHRTSGNDAGFVYRDIAWGSAGYIVVGGFSPPDCIGCGLSYIASKSSDLISWQMLALSFPAGSSLLRHIDWDGLRYVARGRSIPPFGGSISDVIASSTDGSVWQTTALSTLQEYGDVEWRNGRWFAVSVEGVIYTSDDGESWTPLSDLAVSLQAIYVNEVPGMAIVGAEFRFTPIASDHDGDFLTFSIENKPEWAEFDARTGTLWGKPGLTDVGALSGIVISVTDGFDIVSLPPFDLLVTQGAVGTPTISGIPSERINHNDEYVFTPITSDPDGDELSFSIANKPLWADFDPVTGTLSGTPPLSSTGIHAGIVISVSDGKESVALPPFHIEVLNRAPLIGLGLWLAAGSNGIYTSRSLVDWQLSQPSGGGASSFLDPRIGWSGTRFVMVQRRSTVFASEDAQSWQAYPVGHVNNSLQDVVGWDGLFVAVGRNFVPETPLSASGTFYNAAFISEDGESWAIHNIDTEGFMSAIATDGVRYVALGTDTVAGPESFIKVYLSEDGLLWDMHITEIQGSVNDLIWDGERFVAVGDNLVIGSVDGAGWAVLYQADSPTPLKSIAWNGERYMVVGERITTTTIPISITTRDAIVLTSMNGSDWERMELTTEAICVTPPAPPGVPAAAQICRQQTVPAGLRAIDWDGMQFAAMGFSDVMRSVDGIALEETTGADVSDISHLLSRPSATHYSVVSGENFSLSPSASDPDGDDLTYSVDGLPAWATFDEATGFLSGTPGAGDIGSLDHVMISATDGHDTVSLPALQIAVVPGP